MAHSVESPRWFLFLGRLLVWGMFLFLGGGFNHNPVSFRPLHGQVFTQHKPICSFVPSCEIRCKI